MLSLSHLPEWNVFSPGIWERESALTYWNLSSEWGHLTGFFFFFLKSSSTWTPPQWRCCGHRLCTYPPAPTWWPRAATTPCLFSLSFHLDLVLFNCLHPRVSDTQYGNVPQWRSKKCLPVTWHPFCTFEATLCPWRACFCSKYSFEPALETDKMIIYCPL